MKSICSDFHLNFAEYDLAHPSGDLWTNIKNDFGYNSKKGTMLAHEPARNLKAILFLAR
jgi:hypothetical protein